MAGYPIGSLKKAEVLNGLDAVPVTQDGITKQVEKSVMDQAVIITQSGAQSSGIIRREGTFVLNSATLINFTLENATGRKTTNNVTADDAASAAGWKIYVFNTSTISHTVIHGANSWSIASGETLCFYWTGSKFTLHTEVIQDLTVKGNTKLPNVSAVQSITGSDDLAVIASGGLLKKTTPNDIKTALNLVNTTQLNGALANYSQMYSDYDYKSTPLYYKIENINKTQILIGGRGGSLVYVTRFAGFYAKEIFKNKEDNITNIILATDTDKNIYVTLKASMGLLNVMASGGTIKVTKIDSLPSGLTSLPIEKEIVTQTDLNEYQKTPKHFAVINSASKTIGGIPTFKSFLLSFARDGSANYYGLYFVTYGRVVPIVDNSYLTVSITNGTLTITSRLQNQIEADFIELSGNSNITIS